MTRAAYFPIRPSGFKPSPAPYWNELNNAQALVGIGTAGLLTQTPNIIDNSNSLLAKDSAQEIIDNHINKAVTWTPDGMDSRPDAPEEIDLEEWKKRNILSTPIYEPNIDDYSTGGELPEIENTDNVTPIPEIEIPTNTGFPSIPIEKPQILYNKDLEEESNIKEGILGTYEEGKGMAVIHNTGADAIQNYDNIGGMPKPSLAVVPENIEEMKFGEITLVGDPELMIPSKNNPVYKGDAYTQRYPLVRTIYADNEMDQIIDYFSDIFEVDDIRYDYRKISDFKFDDGSNQAVFYAGDLYNQIIEKGINNLPTDMLDMAFLKEKGLLPDFNLAEDKYAYKRLLDEVWTPELNAEYKEWNKSLAERIGVQGKEKIVAGRTPMGKLKYKDHTLENVLAHMKTNAGKEEGFGGSGNIGNLAATMRGKFKNKKELSEARDTFVTSEEMSDIKTDLYTELSRITDLLAKENKHLDPKSYELGDNFNSIFSDKKYSIEQNFKEFYPDTSEATKQEVIKFLEKLANTPSEYFEIKPNRALQMNEFKGAIVPNNTDEKTLQILKDNGIEIKKYNTEKERLDLLKEFEELFASMPVNPLFNYA